MAALGKGECSPGDAIHFEVVQGARPPSRDVSTPFYFSDNFFLPNKAREYYPGAPTRTINRCVTERACNPCCLSLLSLHDSCFLMSTEDRPFTPRTLILCFDGTGGLYGQSVSYVYVPIWKWLCEWFPLRIAMLLNYSVYSTETPPTGSSCITRSGCSHVYPN